ncbi:MAG: YdiU family protein [Gammaproteobacteria bacterium]|nr:MAG: YdiU family protein [Gammaproteobacteria bacterium]
MKSIEQLTFNNTYARLPEVFFSRVLPRPFEQQHLVSINPAVAEMLDLDPDKLNTPEQLALLTGKARHTNMEPVAQCYAGHQFGQYVPRLGDGRAILLGEVETSNHGKLDLQIKGSGLTPYSRDGDGRAVLRSTIREYLCSEAMHGLGIPTSRALCIIGSNEEVYRERVEAGAMLLRVAPTHVRFGTFEYYYHANQYEDIRKLADYVIESNFSDEDTGIIHADNKYLALLDEIIKRTARLLAMWQAVGFCHGVMNSDNMSILGLTLDYGPFGFMEGFDPGYICNHSDHQGRYAYDQQPTIGLFNLSCLAQAILPLIDEVPDAAAGKARDSLGRYEAIYTQHYSTLMRARLGLASEQREDHGLLQQLFTIMAEDRVDYTIAFRRLCDFSSEPGADNNKIRDLFINREAFDQWCNEYSVRLRHDGEDDQQRSIKMKQVNPRYVLRNYMAEIAIRKAEDENDFSEIDRLLTLLRSPFVDHPGNDEYAGFPPAWSQKISVSCSS